MKELSRKESQAIFNAKWKMSEDFGSYMSIPKEVIYRNPRTIVNWTDGTKTVAKCMQGDIFNKELGFLVCLAKKIYGGHNQYKKFIENASIQTQLIPLEDDDDIPF